MRWALIVLMAAACSKTPTSGKKLYGQACAKCHGTDGKGGLATGTSKSRDLTDPAWQAKVTDAQLRTIIKDGKDMMPGFGNILAPEKVDAIVAHLRTLAPPSSTAPPGNSPPGK